MAAGAASVGQVDDARANLIEKKNPARIHQLLKNQNERAWQRAGIEDVASVGPNNITSNSISSGLRIPFGYRLAALASPCQFL